MMLLQPMARELATDHTAVTDFYKALELVTGEDLGGHSVNDLLTVAIDNLGQGTLVDIWRAAFSTGLIDEDALQQWIVYEELTNGSASIRRPTGTEH